MEYQDERVMEREGGATDIYWFIWRLLQLIALLTQTLQMVHSRAVNNCTGENKHIA